MSDRGHRKRKDRPRTRSKKILINPEEITKKLGVFINTPIPKFSIGYDNTEEDKKDE